MDMNEDDSNRKIIQAIISLSESLNLNVIAEGVELDYQKDFLLKMAVCICKDTYLVGRYVQKALNHFCRGMIKVSIEIEN